jgi:hypothetical protein
MNLPPELFAHHIFPYLDKKDMNICRFACKMWNSAIKECIRTYPDVRHKLNMFYLSEVYKYPDRLQCFSSKLDNRLNEKRLFLQQRIFSDTLFSLGSFYVVYFQFDRGSLHIKLTNCILYNDEGKGIHSMYWYLSIYLSYPIAGLYSSVFTSAESYKWKDINDDFPTRVKCVLKEIVLDFLKDNDPKYRIENV